MYFMSLHAEDLSTSHSLHNHAAGQTCPTCDQLLPPDRIEDVLGRLSARDAEKEGAIRANLRKQFDIDKAQAEAAAQAKLDEARQQSLAQIDAAREDERRKAEAASRAILDRSEQARETLQRLLVERTEALTSSQSAAAARETELLARATDAQAKAVSEAIATQEAARKEAEAALQAKLANVESKCASVEQASDALKQQLSELKETKDSEIAQLKETAASEAERIKQEATVSAQMAVTQQLADKDSAVAAAKAKAIEIENNAKLLATQQELAMANNLSALRETMEKAKDEAVSAEKARAFEDNEKLANKVSELQRALEKKSNEELGEGAEVDLYEALRAEFPDDDIQRVKKGQPGADIVHTVKHNGKPCGKIVYDSKNHKSPRGEHVTKLREDQIAEQAEHAILSLLKFPSGRRQLHIDNGIILANPARVTIVASMIRQHLICTHSLRMSAAERESKIGALYGYITSELFSQQLAQIDKHAGEMLELQAAEISQHQKKWKKEGEILRKIQKANAAVSNEVNAIIGVAAETSDDDLQPPAESLFG
jgi:hypothetical protein